MIQWSEMRAIGKATEITIGSPEGLTSIYLTINIDLRWQIALAMISPLDLDSTTERYLSMNYTYNSIAYAIINKSRSKKYNTSPTPG